MTDLDPTPESTQSRIRHQGLMLIGRELDETEWDAAVVRNERPRHYAFDLARTCGLEILTPAQVPPARIDRWLRILVGGREAWALARHAARTTRPHDFVYATDESIGIPYLLIASHRRQRAKATAMFVLDPNLPRARFWLAVLKRLRLMPSTLITGTPETAQHLRTLLGSKATSVDVLCLPVTIDDQFFSPAPEPQPPNERPLVISAGLEQRDYAILAEATRDLDIDVDVCAISPDRASATRIPETLPDNMQFAPLSIAGLRDLYRRADLFVLTTVPNGMGAGLTAVMEALASGLDVVLGIHEPDLGNLVADGLVTRVPTVDADSLSRVIRERLARRSDGPNAPVVRLTHDDYTDRLAQHFAVRHRLRTNSAGHTESLSFGRQVDPELLSVVIPVAGADDRLAIQLQALFKQDAETAFEVVISHNMPDDEQRDRLTDILAPFDNEPLWVVESNVRAGAAHARNAGAAAARGARLAFCDADDVVHPGWIDAMAAALEEYDAVTGAIVEVAADGQDDWRPPATPGGLPTFHGAPYVLSGNLGIRREAFEKVGGFDESLIRCEDIAMGWALQNRDLTIGFAPDAVLDYHHRAGLRKMLVQHYFYGRGMAEVLAKYPNPLHTGETESPAARRLRMLRPNAQPHRRTPVSEMRRLAIGVGRIVGMVVRG